MFMNGIITSGYGKKSRMKDVSVVLGLLDNNDASAVVKVGDTEAACSLFGPVEARGAKDSHNGLLVDVSTRSNVALPTHSHKHIESIITDIVTRCVDCRRFPHMQLSVCIEILADSGMLLSVVGNAVYFALLDSGLPMKHKFVSFSLSSVDGELIMDHPNCSILRAGGPVTVFADPDSGQQLYLAQEDGAMSPDFYKKFPTDLRGFCDAKFLALSNVMRTLEPQLRFSR